MRHPARMPRSVLLTDIELLDLARCCRMGAAQSQRDADAQNSVAVKDIHLKAVGRFNALSDYFKRVSQGGSARRQGID